MTITRVTIASSDVRCVTSTTVLSCAELPRRWGICAEHARQLSEPGMEIWSFHKYPSRDLQERFRWHLRNPSGACEVGKAAVIALARAKAEIWANEREIVVNWVQDDDGWCAVAYDQQVQVCAAIGGFDTEGGRAEEAQVLVEAMSL